MKKIGLKYLFCLFVLPLCGFLLLLSVHFLPTTKMQQHVYNSLDMIVSEFDDEEIIDGYPTTLTGCFTDSLMLEHAVYESNHSALEQSLLMYRPESYYDPADENCWHPGESLADYLNGVPQSREVTYSRYWHGYLVILKPLLLVTSLGSIRMLNAGLFLILLGGIVILFCERKQKGIAFAFVSSLPFLFFSISFSSLSQSVCLYLMMAGIGIQLLFHEKMIEKSNYIFFFLFLGMMTSYFDFLTYPIVTLGYPLIVFLSMTGGALIGKVKRVFNLSFNWGLGYLWMWASKWILCDLLTSEHSIADAFSTLTERTSGADVSRIKGFLTVIKLNIGAYANWGFILLLICYVLVMVVITVRLIIKKKIAFSLKKWIENYLILVVGLYPFAWWFVTQNHSMEHWMFTCRIFSVTVFAVVAFIVKEMRKDEGEFSCNGSGHET